MSATPLLMSPIYDFLGMSGFEPRVRNYIEIVKNSAKGHPGYLFIQYIKHIDRLNSTKILIQK